MLALFSLLYFSAPLLAQGNEVTVLVIQGCPYCNKAEEFLQKKGINYRRYDIERDAGGQALYRKLGGGGVPLIKIGSSVIRGFQPDEILMNLSAQRIRYRN